MPQDQPLLNIGSMSLWHNHFFHINSTYWIRHYAKHELGVVWISDLMNVDTNRFFKWNEWRDFVEAAEKERTGIDPDNNTVISKALTMLAIQRQVPRPVRRELRKNFREQGASQGCKPDAVSKVARRTVAFHVLKDDADRATCMAVTTRIGSNVVGVRCVPSRRSAQCTWCTDETSTDVVSDGGR